MKTSEKEFSQEGFEAWFKEWDTNGNGSISKAELKACMIKFYTDIFHTMMASQGL